MAYTIKQSSWPYKKREDYWAWEIWIEASEAEMAEVAEVHYLLHPTFPNPHRVVKEAEGGFRHRSAGWGEFNIAVVIRLKNGQDIETDHWLKLGEGGVLQSMVPGSKVYLTYAASDADAAAEAKAGLREQGFEVLCADDLAPGIPWEHGLSKMVDSADLVVAIVPRTTNSALERDVELALEKEKPIVPVVIEARGGSDVDVEGLSDRVYLKEPAEIASMVSERIKR